LGRIYPSAAAEYKADNAKILINSEIANYKTRAANEKNPVERKEIFNDLQDYINKQPSSMLSAVDAEAMSSSATSYQLQLEKRTTDAKYGNQQEQFDSFVLDAAKGNFPSVDVIENSILDDEPPKGDRKRASKSIMKKWVDGSVIDPPPVSTPDGFDNVNTAILKLSRGTISKENASYIIMKERYGNNSISSSDFESSIEKLDNLYPKETIPHIESIISLNRESLTGTSFWFTLDKTQQNNLQKVNSGFIGWLDKQIKDGKTPTPREMFIANAEYMTTVSDWEKTKENNAEYKKGDRRTVNDRTFIFNGVDWD